MPGPAAKSLVLTDHERSVLVGWVRRPTSSARLVQRASIVLAYADDLSVAGVARRLGVSAPTVAKWRDRFLVGRLDGLDDAPRPGQPRKLTDEQINALITRTLQDAPPKGDTQWSTRSMAAGQGLNQTQVSRIWRAFGLKPHAVDS
ncbi:IS630 family transposase ISMsm2 [Austwickia sp. TVS 96-490-7B]|nr:IS630 family transposase ISMsm2 [Austwickia sp. TVS 96-490-7B]